MAQEISRKINILEMHSSLGYAGGQRNMVSFAKFLNKDLFNVFVCGYLEGGSQELKLKELNIPYCSALGKIDVIKDFIVKNKIDVIHIHRSGHYNTFETQIINTAKSINTQMVVIEKNVFGKFDQISHKQLDCSFFQSIMHLNERYLPSSGLKFDFEKMKVMYNIVDKDEFEKYRLNEKEILEFKKSIGIKSEDFIVGKIARPHVAKWSDLILDMMPYLVKLIPEIKLVIIGVPQSRKIIIEKSSYKDKIIILEPTANDKFIHSFYQSIDLLAHASKIGECNGNTINEAMFWGKPVVVNSTPHKDNGQLEQVLHMKNGIIANYPQTYARAIFYLYNNKEKLNQMSSQAIESISINNNPLKIVRMLEKFIFETINRKRIFNNNLVGDYNMVNFFPSETDIINYYKEYRVRLNNDFGKLSLKEKIINKLILPKKFYFKVKDFLEDKDFFKLN